MRLFGVHPDGEFTEYVQTPFHAEREEAVLEGWLESNPDGIVEDGKIFVIGRQVPTDLGGFIDLLGLDRQGSVVVIELKRNRTPRDTLAQALEYASCVGRLDVGQLEGIFRWYLRDESASITEYHRAFFELASDEAVAFNKDQRIVIVAQRITPEIRHTALFLCSKGIKITCVEFTFFQTGEGTSLLSQEIVVGNEFGKPSQPSSGSLPRVTEGAFLTALDDSGRAVFSRILGFAREKSMPIHWGSRGFSLNVDLEGKHTAVCYGYPVGSVFKQSVYTAMAGQGGMAGKTAVPEELLEMLRREAESTGLFTAAGREMKCPITRPFSEAEISALLTWIGSAAEAINRCGLKE